MQIHIFGVAYSLDQISFTHTWIQISLSRYFRYAEGMGWRMEGNKTNNFRETGPALGEVREH